ncbi:MAG: methyl-accepting chemotaxis protein, partial [Brachymonas sp.]|nr:methyl-accepting chemotaxis protein [Brachymonas sp.]
LLLLFVFSLLTAIALGIYAISRGNVARGQLAAVGAMQLSAARLGQNLNSAVLGEAAAFPELKRDHDELRKNLEVLRAGSDSAASPVLMQDLDAIQNKLGATTGKDIDTIVGQQSILVPLVDVIGGIRSDVTAIQEQTDGLKLLLTQRGAPASQVQAVGDISTLAERVEKYVKEFLTPKGLDPEGVFALGKDQAALGAIIKGLQEGKEDWGIEALQAPEELALVAKIQEAYAPMSQKSVDLLQQMQTIVSARQAQNRVAERLRTIAPDIVKLNADLGGAQSAGGIRAVPLWVYAGLAFAGLVSLLSAIGLAYVQIFDTRRLQQRAENENKQNQVAIMRLMDELQSVADGDLTQEATVTEDITGSLADSFNATVEDLRALVGNVQGTADKVAQTTADVELTSNTLLEASTEQLTEIRNTGQSVLDMAERINTVSSQAQESAQVAQRSREAAEQGYKAVQDSIEGMNLLRDQIQDTSKRIKRLGESSQEISEMTELISDITEQTNVLALNAAIQAASAGEAGRGFSVVAEEVQRLAERSGEATKQIAALVKTIQTDTHDAVAAMERSTQGVVEGARLSDNAGQALGEIDAVSRLLSELIQKISETTYEEAVQANTVAGNIQNIFSVTEQTTEGTRTTAQEVRTLAKVAQELRDSVARFRIK